MGWTKFHLKKPLSSIILYSIILAMGIFCIPNLRFSVSPESYSPVISIKTQYFGMNSKYIEKNITMPIENAVSSIKGVKSISSVSEDGQSIVILNIDPSRPIKIATLEIKSSVDTVRENFPSDVQEPVISHYDPSQMPVMIISYYSDKINLKEVRRTVEQKVKASVQKIDGVVECVVTGGEQSEIGIFVNTGRLYMGGLQLRDINRQVQQNNISSFLGKINNNRQDIPVFSVGKYASLYEINKIAVLESDTNESAFQQLDKLADVENYHKKLDNISRINGMERVSLYIQKQNDGNILKICGSIRRVLKGIDLKDIHSEIDFDKSEEISESLNNLISSIIIGMVLLFIIMLIFIGDYKKSLVAVIPLPISVAVTLIIASLFQIELNSIIMSGIALGAGLLVSDGIIIVEFLNKKKPENMNYHILWNIKRLFPPLTAALFTMICVFLPIVFSTPDIRALYTGFSIVITIMLVTSLFLSTGLVPVAYKLLAGSSSGENKSMVRSIMRKTEYGYVKMLKSLLKKKSLFLTAITLCTVLFSMAVFFKGKSLSSSDSIKEVYAYVEPSTGTSLGATDDLTKAAEEILLKQGEIKKVISKVEKAHATIIIKLKKEWKEKELEKLITEYKKKLSAVDCFIYFTYGESENNNKEINVMFVGDNADNIKDISKEASKKLYALPYFSEVILRFKDDSPVYRITPELDKIQLSGLSLKDIADEARMFLYGVISSKLNPENEGMTDIRIASLLSRSEKSTIQDFLNMMVRNQSGALVPLREFLTVTKDTASSKIYRYNKRRNYTITARLKAGLDLSAGMKAVEKELGGFKLPEGYYWQFDEKYETLSKNTSIMLLAIIAAVYLTFVTLVICYEGFRKAVHTIFVIPFSFIGIGLALYFLGINISTPVYIGIILLAGTTVKNSVLLLSDIKPGRNMVQIFHSCREKLNSIYMTTLTTVIGLIPLIFTGGNGQYIWKPFAITVVFGLISSTVLCLFVIPLIAKGKMNNAGTAEDNK